MPAQAEEQTEIDPEEGYAIEDSGELQELKLALEKLSTRRRLQLDGDGGKALVQAREVTDSGVEGQG